MSRSRDLTPVHSAAPVASLGENTAIDRLPPNSGQPLIALLVQLRGLDTKEAKTTQLHEKIQAAAIKYKQHDFKASRYVFSAQMFAEDIILGFEGVRDGTYTLEEVLDELNTQINEQNLLTPLEEVAQGLGSVAREIGECIGESGLVASAYRQSAHNFGLARDVTADIANRRADASALGTMVGLSSNTVNVLTIVCSVLSQTTLAWATAEQQRLQENQRLLEDLRTELGQVSCIVENQGKLVGDICELLPKTAAKQKGAERRLASGQPTRFVEDVIIRDARRLKDLCSNFSARVARR